eukprot:6012601-Pyramimonas_sp.AAC.1
MGSELARKRKSMICPRCLTDLGFGVASLEVSDASWSRLGTFLGPLVACRGAIWRHRALS